MDYIALGERIKNERLKLKLTQEKLAERVDVSVSFIGHIERGGKKLSIETLVKIAHELDLSIDYILLGSLKIKPDTIMNEIISNVTKKDQKKAIILVNVIKTLADNIDKWAE